MINFQTPTKFSVVVILDDIMYVSSFQWWALQKKLPFPWKS